MTAAVESSQPQLPSYNEALQWGFTPPPRVQWAPPREDSNSPRPRTARPRTNAVRPFSMSTIDEPTTNVHGHRPRTSSGGPLPVIGLDDILLDALSGASRAVNGPLSPASPISPARPSTAQPDSSRNFLTVPSSSPYAFPEPLSPAYSPTQEEFIPEPVPLHPRPPIPPGYARHDPTAATFLMHSPLIYSSSGSSPQTPAYQLDTRLSKAGRPYQLRIRPLDHLESRTLAFSDDHRNSGRFLRYEEEHTLYLLQVMQLIGGFGVPGLGFGPSWRVEMHRDPYHDHGRGTRGFIRFEGGGFLGMGKGFMRKSGCKFWYMTRKSEREREAQNESKMSAKYGYQPEFEWNRRLMFSVEKRRGAMGLGGRSKGYEWKDGKGRVVAVESAEGRLDLSRVAASMSPQSRESLLACWVGKSWASGALEL
ncbi:hypothetical protein N8I77_005520 [Diaporthe amygdali]|uniref:Uncharacterized protein n=1 Tax=Phomopsis amygdali TaxID=1214568 RepID=A0AAD9SE55_PHOAM|nr:hypothetical protein N8I77_005520 [Diaporthe amygdali]